MKNVRFVEQLATTQSHVIREKKQRTMQRVNLIEEDDESGEEQLVLRVYGAGAEPFTLSGKMNNRPFKAIIDSGSPVSIFSVSTLKEILKKKS